MARSIAAVIPGQRVIDDGDMQLWRALPNERRDTLGPFVFIDHYRHHSQRGIGDRPHPHAGIEVLSYLLEGSVVHRDSMGNTDRLDAGEAQYILAGRGLLHAEVPQSGRHGLQLWTSLPPEMKHHAPRYQSYRADRFPLIDRDGVRGKVLAGQVDGQEGPIHLASPTVWAVLHLKQDARITLEVDPQAELGIYVLDGAITNSTQQPIGKGNLVVLSNGDGSVHIATAPGQSADVTLLGGAKVTWPQMFAGPFVMDTAERIVQAQRDYASGAWVRSMACRFNGM